VKRGWIAASSVFLALFVGAVYMASKLALLDALGPGPGFFPLILGVLGAVLAALLIERTIRAPAAASGEVAAETVDEEGLIPDRPAMFRIISILVLLTATFLALDPVGYRLTALAFITLALLALGVRNVVAIAIVAIVGSFGVFHSFYYWLKVPLPIGMFGI